MSRCRREQEVLRARGLMAPRANLRGPTLRDPWPCGGTVPGRDTGRDMDPDVPARPRPRASGAVALPAGSASAPPARSAIALRWLGAGGYTAMLAAGYAYNLTFVQLGLSDLATATVGLSEGQAAMAMAVLALATCGVALLAGWRLRGASLRMKLAVAAGVVAAQTGLTALTPFIETPGAFAAWLAVAAASLGLGIPVTFGMATELVPVRWRGAVAAAITALAYGGAIAFLGQWDPVVLSARLVPLMALGAIGLALLAIAPGPLRPVVEALADQARDPTVGIGRFTGPRAQRRLVIAAVLLFAVFFVDSLGFLRLMESPYITAAWQSAEALDRSALIGAHVLGALAAGILYATFDERMILPWIFGIFAVVALLYVLDVRIGAASTALAMPLLYAIGVSLYTVLTFALWPDLSTPSTITRNVAIGVALSGWSATFLSTGLAFAWRSAGMDFDQHLSWVAAFSLLVLAAFGLHRALRPAAPVPA
jgi:hypothetical protein